NLGLLVGFVNFHAGDFGRAERLGDVFDSVVAEDDDVDLLLLADFAHDGVDTGAVAANEGADRVDAGHGASDGQFGAHAGFAGHAFNLDGAVVHFGHFGAEQPFHELLRAAGNNQLRAAEAA